MLHTGILISAISKASILLIVAIIALAIVGIVVDILAKKKGKGIKLNVGPKKVKNTTPVEQAPAVEQPVQAIEEAPVEAVADVEETPAEEVIEEPVTEEVPAVEEAPVVEDEPADVEVVADEPVVENVAESSVVEEAAEAQDTSGKGFVSNAYSRSYMSKLIQSEPTTQDRYSQIKNELLSYAKMRSSVAWTNETFRTGNKTVARIMLRGKTVLLLLALDPNEFTTTKYAGEDVSDVKRYANTPMRLRVTSERRLKYALELIALLVGREGYEKNSYTPVQYTYEYQTDEQLIEAGLIKVE